MAEIDSVNVIGDNPRVRRQVNVIRFVLPIVLFLLVFAYEYWEHIVVEQDGILPEFTVEVLVFGVLGPVVMFGVLTYLQYLLKKQALIMGRLEQLNENLEKQVDRRTVELAERNMQLDQANQELQQLDQMKSEFVALVSHELRAPLTRLNGGLELALRDADSLSPRSTRLLTLMSQESTRLTALVQRILSMSHIETGKLKLNLGPVAVLPLLEHVAEIAVDPEEREIRISSEKNVPPIYADEQYVTQIIENLFTNACKYTPVGSPIVVHVSMFNRSVQITVTDFGPGIPLEDQKHIFERFYRRVSAKTRTGDGWGLGLYFSQALARIQNGDLAVESPAHDSAGNPGARFILTLPVTTEIADDVKFTDR